MNLHILKYVARLSMQDLKGEGHTVGAKALASIASWKPGTSAGAFLLTTRKRKVKKLKS